MKRQNGYYYCGLIAFNSKQELLAYLESRGVFYTGK